MTQSREFNAATVEQALEKAAVNVGVPREELSFEVLDEGSTGFLGIGARDARILVHNVVATEAESEESEGAEEAVVAEASAVPVSAEPVLEEGPAEAVAAEPEVQHETAPEELLEEVREAISSVLKAMGFDATIDVYDADDFIAADVTVDNTALFIGQKGETIDALQYLTNASIYRERPFIKRVVLDAEGYRQRRVEAVQGLAHRTARRAIREGRPVELPPMNASERRVVHLYLQDNSQVTTASEGSGEDRKVRISPA